MSTANFTIDDKMSPQQVELHNLIQHILIVLSEKEKYIIQNRFALEGHKRMTLEEIGQHFGVTRERIRQIEKSALRKLERNAQNTNIKILTEFAKTLLQKEGGIAQDQYFKDLLLKILPNINEEILQDLHLALILDSEIHFESNTLKYHPYWRLVSFDGNSVKQISSATVKLLQKTRHVMKLDKIKDKLKTQKLSLSKSTLKNLLQVSKDIKFTEAGLGLYSWRHIHPRTLRDKILFIFNQEKKPLHFTKIAQSIKVADFDSKKINIQAVHNELIRNENFILIGRGIYALKEWGFQTGTVSDVIKRILEDGTPRTRDEITKLVLDQRQVKTITIYLNLKNKSQFVRVGREHYTLEKFEV
jgi:hypothetical protein